MSKRPNADPDADNPYKKRQRTTTQVIGKYASTDINSSQDLQDILTFTQDTVAGQFTHNVKSFKLFLDSIAYGEDSDDQSIKRGILLEYLNSQTTPAESGPSRYLADIIHSWSFSAQSNNEGLFSAITAVLALLLKATSNHIEFREHGNNLCRTLLQENQLKLFDRGLGASKAKEHVISPCLRLLTEIVLYDGGTAATIVYAHREITLKRIDVFLGIRKASTGANPETQRKLSVRTNALRYLFANIRLQSRSAKSNLLADGKMIRAVFHDIKEDVAFVVLEILTFLKKEVVDDSNLAYAVKSRLFGDSTLRSLATLYQLGDHEDESDEVTRVRNQAHELLLCVCTTAEQGILKLNREAHLQDNSGSEFGGRDLVLATSQKRKEVANVTLSSFLQSLRPYADLRQCELVLAMFTAAPDLVPDYFLNKSFSFEPKLTSTWAGYSNFLLSSIQIPLPYDYISGKPPFHLSSIIESIIPQPLTKKALTRCLNQSSNLIRFFTVRIMTAAFKKLAKLLELLAPIIQDGEGETGGLWHRAQLDVINEFRKRCPEMKHVIAVFRNCSADSPLFREGAARLLAMYYKHLPQLALEEKLDISLALSDSLKQNSLYEGDSKINWLRRLELYSFLEIARRSPDMRWWHKPDDLLLSPFTTVIRLLVASPHTDVDGGVRLLMREIVEETTLLDQATTYNSFEVLLLSLQDFKHGLPSNSLFEFLDNSILRCLRKPVKYHDDLAAIVSGLTLNTGEIEGCKVDLLLVTILDQWPFLTKSENLVVIKEVTLWLVRYLDFIMHNGGSLALLSTFREMFKRQVRDKDTRGLLEQALREPTICGTKDELKKINRSSQQANNPSANLHQEASVELNKDIKVPQLPTEDEDHPALVRWAQMGISEAIKDGQIGGLILCLCSKYEDIRKQAILNLGKFSGILQKSEYSEWQQTYLLIGEVIEAARNEISDNPFPSFAGVFAARSLLVLAEPLHFMYTKINRFLNKSPHWVTGKLPSYWVDKILLNPPTNDDAHHEEVDWLLDALTDGLRTAEDLEIYRRCHVFERLMSMAAFSLPRKCENGLTELLFRCTLIGGSTTLITRSSLLSWIKCRLNSSRTRSSDHAILKHLAHKAYETSDKKRVSQWSNGNASESLHSLLP